MTKMCKYSPDKRCYWSSCSVFDCDSGNVYVCRYHRGGNLVTPRKVVVRLLRSFSR